MTQDGIEAGMQALGHFGDVVRAALLSEAASDEVIALMADVGAGLADLSADAARQGRAEAAERFDALRVALSRIAAHLARGDRLAALQALDAGSFPRALEALRVRFSPPVAAAEGAAA
ncbi:hypothetical protein OCH239_16210 [Roseivivax halodurans JCM 10272]|uniref:HPt domain-containing protein n=1 Tax=Roseivivax halodurans JCM 10272 TaxID=1449350 RepID=X7EK31_9RHOB|nr:hypothetical protein [Roseivivax halodurans]ETX15498.1 hypothetical protein OCH239_16210 [Roseivivax halodurans JCM 10272]